VDTKTKHKAGYTTRFPIFKQVKETLNREIGHKLFFSNALQISKYKKFPKLKFASHN